MDRGIVKKKKQEAEDLDQIKRRLDWFLIR
jgi:hypothetical protein